MKHLPHLLATVLLLLVSAPASAQHEPAVLVRSQLLCPGPVCRPGNTQYGTGNGVVIGRSSDNLLVLTVAHNLEGSASTEVQIQSRWYPARVLNVNTERDVAVLAVDGRFDVPVARVEQRDPPDGAAVIIDGYWPQPWTRKVINTRRIRAQSRRFYFLQSRVVPGVSGAGVVYNGGLAGLVHGVTLEGASSVTLVVPASDIHWCLSRWGYRPKTTPAKPQLVINDPPPASPEVTPDCAAPGPGNLTCECDCDARFAELERRLTLAVSQLTVNVEQIRQDAGSSGRDAATEIAALTEQIDDIRSDLEQLTPLIERRVILVSDGKITSERVLSPSDPIVLSSKLVNTKATDAE